MKLLDKLKRVDELTAENAMRVFDVVFDIHGQLNIGQGSTVTVPAAPQAVKYKQLLPLATSPALDEYEAGRRQACAYLQEIGVITKYSILNEHGQRVWRRLEITVADAAVLEEILSMLRTKVANSASSDTAAVHELTYDPEYGKLSYGHEAIVIEGGTLQHYICKLLFENQAAKVNGLDVVEEWGGEEKPQSLYDACRLLNRKAEKAFGLRNILACREGKVWLNTSQ